VHLEVPAGLVTADVEVEDGRARAVTITNVPSFVHATDVTARRARGRTLVVDVAFGGNFYALVPAERLGIPLEPAREQDLIRAGMAVIAAVDAQSHPVHPEDDRIRGIEHLVVTAPGDDGAEGGGPVDGRSATVIHPGWIDRSPCGTGTSARMALLHHRGELALGDALRPRVVHRLPLRGPLVGDDDRRRTPAIVPTIRGRAWVSGRAEFVLDPTDPFPGGFLPSLGRMPGPDAPAATATP
jgi:proline racemase